MDNLRFNSSQYGKAFLLHFFLVMDLMLTVTAGSKERLKKTEEELSSLEEEGEKMTKVLLTGNWFLISFLGEHYCLTALM
tara:strand:+ start:1503 stop:1742 length:240 start_codon:yes stop_codon:yes gene_type:complete